MASGRYLDASIAILRYSTSQINTLGGKQAKQIAFSDICAKPGDWFGVDDFSGPRFEAAETKYPGIVVRDMPKPVIDPTA